MNAGSFAAVSCVGSSTGCPRSSSFRSSTIRRQFDSGRTTSLSPSSVTSVTEGVCDRSVTIARASQCADRCFNSSASNDSGHGTTTKPPLSAPSAIECQSGVRPTRTTTRSPGTSPRERSKDDQRLASRATSLNVRRSMMPSWSTKVIACRNASAVAAASTTSRVKLNRAGIGKNGSGSGASTTRLRSRNLPIAPGSPLSPDRRCR